MLPKSNLDQCRSKGLHPDTRSKFTQEDIKQIALGSGSNGLRLVNQTPLDGPISVAEKALSAPLRRP